MTLATDKTEYKDFFESTDHLVTDKVDYNYRKTKVSESSTFDSDFVDNLASFERFDAEKTLPIYNYLKYKLPSIKDETTRKWYSKNIRFFDKLLNIKNNTTCFITPSDIFLQQRYSKIDYKGDKTVGRLYNFDSINTLPREIRYYLFKDIYIDIDIANAHPSLLYLYSKEKSIQLNGSLKGYIEDRHSVVQNIQQELSMDLALVKSNVLKLLNKTWDNKPFNPSKTLKGLDEDFQTIRDHLWSSYCKGELDNYKSPIHSSVEKKKKVYTLEDGKINEHKLLNLKKVSLQSFYCQTQESVHLIALVDFLRHKYKEYLKKESKLKFTDYYPYTNKRVELGAEHTLFVIPFFDGLYLSSPCKSFMRDLNSLIAEYNMQGSGVVFVQKEIEERKVYIPDTDELKKFIIIYTWLGRSTIKYYLHMLLHKKNIHLKFLNILKDNLTIQNTAVCEDPSINWDITYKDIVDDIKSDVFKILLEYSIKKEADIESIILDM